MDKKEIQEVLDYMAEADQHVTEDLFICGFHTDSIKNKLCLNAYQYLNGAVIPNVFFRTDINLSYPNLVSGMRGNPMNQLDTSGLLDPESLIPLLIVQRARSTGAIVWSMIRSGISFITTSG